jgi:hypothetical protein
VPLKRSRHRLLEVCQCAQITVVGIEAVDRLALGTFNFNLFKLERPYYARCNLSPMVAPTFCEPHPIGKGAVLATRLTGFSVVRGRVFPCAFAAMRTPLSAGVGCWSSLTLDTSPQCIHQIDYVVRP